MSEDRNELCPVCRMTIENDDHSMEHHKSFYHFCSEQCRETFQSRPRLYIGKQVKETGEVIKRRRLQLSTAITPQATDNVLQQIKKLMGVKEIHLQDRCLIIRYDLLQLNLSQLEAVLVKMEIELDKGWWHKLTRAWINNSEQNELGNLAAPRGACCNRPPPRA